MNNRQSISGVSIGMKKTLASLRNGNPLVEMSKPSEFTIKVANSLEEREAVFKLGYQVYLKKGFIKENPQELLVRSYDANPSTLILMVQDKNKNVAGSVTLVFDGPSRLPAETIYRQELNILREQNEKIVEISRLVVDADYRNSKEILVLLFNYLYIYSYYVKGYTSLVIEVNPRHTTYYQELLNFKKIGDEKQCPTVKNAPAMLMYLPIKQAQKEKLATFENGDIQKKNRSLYSFFVKPEQENLVAYYLKKQVKPMTHDEKIYFGFTESGVNRAICV